MWAFSLLVMKIPGSTFLVINNHSQLTSDFISVLIKFCFFWPLLPCGSKNGTWRQEVFRTSLKA